jgi:hypothetical protein
VPAPRRGKSWMVGADLIAVGSNRTVDEQPFRNPVKEALPTSQELGTFVGNQ